MTDSGNTDQGISIRWFFLPPFVAVFTVLVADMLGTGQRIPVDAALWSLTGLLFVVLTVLYGLFIRQEFFGGLFPVQLIAQGLLLIPAALHSGARMLQWVGVTMAVCGGVVLVALYHYRSRSAVFSVPERAPGPDFSSLPIPAAVTDCEGNIIAVSDALLKLADQPRAAAEGEKITLLLPLDQENISFGGKSWRILQTSMDNGIYYFQLEELHDASAAASPAAPHDEGDPFTDSSTTLYTRAYAARRATEELYRIRRYQRWMSAALLRMTFNYPSGTDGRPGTENAIFEAYCRFVRVSTREADIPSLIRPREILVVMPETSLEAGKDVASRLSDFQPALQDLLSGFEGSVAVRSGVSFFGAGAGGIDFDGFLQKMDETLGESPPEGSKKTA